MRNLLITSLIFLPSFVFSQNVGIGTQTPTSKLEVQTETGFPGITHTDGTIRLTTLLNSPTSAAFGTTTNHPLHFFTNNIFPPAMSISTDGNVGVGGALASDKLEVFTADGNYGVSHSAAGIKVGTFIGGGGAWYGTPTNNPLYLYANTRGTNILALYPNGNVGIGMNPPAEKLSVQTATNNYGLIHTDGNITLGTYLGGSTINGGWLGTRSNHPLMFYTNGNNTVMTLLQNGNVGIGTTAPNDAAILHVETSTTNKGIVITGAYNPAAVIPNFNEGGRMLFYPARAAFRAGYSNTVAWSNANIGNFSIGLGTNTIAKGDYSTAFGNSTTATGGIATAMGNATVASGAVTTAMGEGSVAMGDHSTAMGYYTIASGRYSTAMGRENSSKAWSSTVVGAYSDPIIANAETSQNPLSPLFIVGNGINANNRSNAMVVLNNGRVGIGSNTPIAPLHVKWNSFPTLPQMWIEETENDFARLSFSNTGTTGNWWTIAALPQATNPASVMNFFYKGLNNDVFSLHGDGTAWLAGTLTQNSDIRLKINILPISSSLSHIMQLQGYQYKWKDENRDQDIQFGLLAQEVQKVFPELVKKDAKDMLGINYISFIPVLINAMKEQQQTIQTLEMRLAKLEEKQK